VLILDQRFPGRELIDGPVDSMTELSESFRDIALANRRFGGIAVARFALRNLRAQTVLDVGTGSGDIPASLQTHARERGRTLEFTCLDSSAQVVALANATHGSNDALRFVQATARGCLLRTRRSTSRCATSRCTISTRPRQWRCCANCGASRASRRS